MEAIFLEISLGSANPGQRAAPAKQSSLPRQLTRIIYLEMHRRVITLWENCFLERPFFICKFREAGAAHKSNREWNKLCAVRIIPALRWKRDAFSTHLPKICKGIRTWRPLWFLQSWRFRCKWRAEHLVANLMVWTIHNNSLKILHKVCCLTDNTSVLFSFNYDQWEVSYNLCLNIGTFYLRYLIYMHFTQTKSYRNSFYEQRLNICS